jgi:hypothetical protein
LEEQDDYDVGVLCVGECYQAGAPYTHMYWAKWALALMGEGFILAAPAVHYEREGDKIIRTNVRKDTQHIYVLTDEYDSKGRRLGVWPD